MQKSALADVLLNKLRLFQLAIPPISTARSSVTYPEGAVHGSERPPLREDYCKKQVWYVANIVIS